VLWLGSGLGVMVRVWSLFDCITAAFSLWIHLSQKDKLPTTSRSVQLEAEAKTRDTERRMLLMRGTTSINSRGMPAIGYRRINKPQAENK